MKKYMKYFLSFIIILFLSVNGNILDVSAQTSSENLNENHEISQVDEHDDSGQISKGENDSEEAPSDTEEDLVTEEVTEKITEESTEDKIDDNEVDVDEESTDDDDSDTEEENPSEDIEKSEEEGLPEEVTDSQDTKETEETATSKEEVESEVNEEKVSDEPVMATFGIQTYSLDASIQELTNRPEVQTVAYHASISATNGNIHNQPNSLMGSVQLDKVTNYNNQNIIVRREGLFENRTWILAEQNGKYIGWMLKDKIIPDYEKVTDDRTVAYNGLLETNGRYQIFNVPAYTKGNYQVSNSSNYTGESVVVRGEIETDYEQDRVWSLIEINGKLIGWINSNALTPVYNNILDEKTVAYGGAVNTNGRYQIFSRPAYTEGNYQVADSTDFTGKDIIVRGEVKTDYYGGTTWSLIEEAGKEIGWINNSAITPDYDTVSDEKVVAYDGTVATNGRYQIFSRPAYTEGNYQVADSSNYSGSGVVIREQIQTADNRTWVLIESKGNELGWINSNAIEKSYDTVQSSRALSHPRIIRNLNGRYQLFSAPAYTKGNYQVDNILNYAGQQGMITQERVTNRAVWHLLSIDGMTLGWINDKGLRKPRIFIDPGHGGKDPGASHGGVKEKDLNLSTGRILKDQLESTGYYNVVMARETDEFLELREITDKANKEKPDIFVSVHYNSMGGSGAARGIETFIHHRVPSGFGQETNHSKFKTENPRIKESLDLAKAIHSNLIKDTGMYDRGVKGNNYHVVRETNMPAVLLELGFLDNAAERNRVVNTSYHRTAARAIVKGINEYFIH